MIDLQGFYEIYKGYFGCLTECCWAVTVLTLRFSTNFPHPLKQLVEYYLTSNSNLSICSIITLLWELIVSNNSLILILTISWFSGLRDESNVIKRYVRNSSTNSLNMRHCVLISNIYIWIFMGNNDTKALFGSRNGRKYFLRDFVLNGLPSL